MPKPPRPSASEVLRHNLLIRGGLPSLTVIIPLTDWAQNAHFFTVQIGQNAPSLYRVLVKQRWGTNKISLCDCIYGTPFADIYLFICVVVYCAEISCQVSIII